RVVGASTCSPCDAPPATREEAVHISPAPRVRGAQSNRTNRPAKSAGRFALEESMAARLVTLLLGLLATTIGLPPEQADPALWGEVAIRTGVMSGTVAYVREFVWKGLDGIAVHVFAAATGVALAFALSIPGVTSGTPFDLIVLGLQATFAATLVDLGLKKAGGGSGNQRLAP